MDVSGTIGHNDGKTLPRLWINLAFFVRVFLFVCCQSVSPGVVETEAFARSMGEEAAKKFHSEQRVGISRYVQRVTAFRHSCV